MSSQSVTIPPLRQHGRRTDAAPGTPPRAFPPDPPEAGGTPLPSGAGERAVTPLPPCRGVFSVVLRARLLCACVHKIGDVFGVEEKVVDVVGRGRMNGLPFRLEFLMERSGPPCSRCGMDPHFRSSASGGAAPIRRYVFTVVDWAPVCAPCLTRRERELLRAYLLGMGDALETPPKGPERRVVVVRDFAAALSHPGLDDRDVNVRGVSRRRRVEPAAG